MLKSIKFSNKNYRVIYVKNSNVFLLLILLTKPTTIVLFQYGYIGAIYDFNHKTSVSFISSSFKALFKSVNFSYDRTTPSCTFLSSSMFHIQRALLSRAFLNILYSGKRVIYALASAKTDFIEKKSIQILHLRCYNKIKRIRNETKVLPSTNLIDSFNIMWVIR